MRVSRVAATEADMRRIGSELSRWLKAGDALLLFGPLGAGKTTLVRGLLSGLGYQGEVRSPSFNLLQPFPTDPPVLHADLFRVPSAAGLGIEEYLDSHVCAIEWAEKAEGLVAPETAWIVEIEFDGDGRRLRILPPKGRPFA